MIEINYRDSRPIYEQIKDSMRKLIVTGVIRENEKLPSVRELASQNAINPNTIQRAYRELEQEGYTYSVPGKGSFAAPQDEVLSQRIDEIMPDFEKLLRELFSVGLSPEELKEKIDEIARGMSK